MTGLNRPSDEALVGVLAERFLVHPVVIVGWLKMFDARAVTEAIAEKFVP